MFRHLPVTLSTVHKKTARPEGVAGSWWNERSVQRPVDRDRRGRGQRIALSIGKTLLVGPLQGTGDGPARIDGTAVFPIMSILKYDVSGFLATRIDVIPL